MNREPKAFAITVKKNMSQDIGAKHPSFFCCLWMMILSNQLVSPCLHMSLYLSHKRNLPIIFNYPPMPLWVYLPLTPFISKALFWAKP